MRNVTFGGLKGYSGLKWISRKKTPPSYTDPGGPKIVDTHSYKLSPLGPALQLGGGSRVISANSFWILFAEVPKAFDIFGLHLVGVTGVWLLVAELESELESALAGLLSRLLLGVTVVAAAAVVAVFELGPAVDEDILNLKFSSFPVGARARNVKTFELPFCVHHFG